MGPVDKKLDIDAMQASSVFKGTQAVERQFCEVLVVPVHVVV